MKTKTLLLFVVLMFASLGMAQANEGQSSVAVVSEYLTTQDWSQSALHSYFAEVGDILGDEIDVLNLIPLGEDVVIAEYIYQGTAFTGDDYMRQNMLAPVELHIRMVSVFQIEDGVIVNEVLFKTTSAQLQ